MALGLSLSGFKHSALVEWNHDSCETLRINAKQNLLPISEKKIFECDIAAFDYSGLPKELDVLAAGVPCQPFSIGGKHLGHADSRNLFPQTVEAITRLKPRAILIENVRGLTRQSFAKYFGYVQLMLSYPEVSRKKLESWLEHLERLERYHTLGKPDGLHYRVVARVLNASDYGVPQKRERVFLVGFRSDLNVEWSFPKPTHSQGALLISQFDKSDYWDVHRVPKSLRVKATSETIKKLTSYKQGNLFLGLEAWKTVRDAVVGLGEPHDGGNDRISNDHTFIPGAKIYAGHTGSHIDEPAKTLKAGDHGVPGGENMVRNGDGSVRYFTIRESARLQTFPDDYTFAGAWGERMRQIGNAVPVQLAAVLGKEIRQRLKDV